MAMRVVFMGSPQFAADILEELSQHAEVVCVYTQPDRVRGRGNKLVPTPVKELAQSLGIAVRTPITLKDPVEYSRLAALKPDVVCVAAYGAILPKNVLDVPTYGCINVHASLLPRWRGAAPVERAIMAGDEFAGVCIMRMEEGLDTGDYCIVRKIPIEGKGAEELTEDLALLGASALIAALSQIEAGRAHWISQSESDVTYAEKLKKGELDLYPSYSTVQNLRLAQAASAAHPCRIVLDGKPCAIEEARAVEGALARELEGVLEGEEMEGAALVFGRRLFLGDSDGFMEVTRIKPAGKNSMMVKAYLLGAKLGGATRWGAA